MSTINATSPLMRPNQKGRLEIFFRGKKPDSCRKVSAFLEERTQERQAEWCDRREEGREGKESTKHKHPPILFLEKAR